jgi:hypothetical protein
MPADDVNVNITFAAIPRYTITVADDIENGTISDITAESEKAGEPVMFQVTPAEHYAIDAVTVSCEMLNLAVEVTDEGDGLYSFVMPADNVTINATFKQVDFQVALNYNAEQATVDGVQNEQYVAAGEEVLFEVTPAQGYQLTGVTITAGNEAIVPDVAENTYSFIMPESDVNINIATELAPVPTRVITGKVVDKKGNALEGVSVVALVKNVEPAGISRLKAEGDLSTTTDENGEFSLEVPADQQYDLTFSKAGYKSQTVGEDEVPGTGLVMAKDYPTAIDAIVADENVAGVKYVSVNGQVSDQPFDGVNIVVIEKVDGTKTVTKIRK